MGVCNSHSAPPIDTTVNETVSNVEITFTPYTTGRLFSASSARPEPPPDAASGSVDVPARPKEASKGRQ